MNDMQKIEQFVLSQFADLINGRGFRGPEIRRDESMTQIDYLKGNLGIELELDWREFGAFLLVVRLENGQLPNGYYLSNGRKCRKHIGNIIREQNWSDITNLPMVSTEKRGKPLSIEDMKNMITVYRKQLFSCLDRLESAEDAVFV
jgi:hypothetical protein